MRKGIKPFLGVCAFCLCAFPLTHADAKTIVGEKEYSDLNTAIKEIGAQEATFKITEDETTAMSISIPAGANYTIDGGNNKVSYSFNLDAKSSENTTLNIKNIIMDGQNSLGMAIISKNQNTKPNELTLSVVDSSIMNYKNKGLYLTNIKKLLVDNVKFNELATTEQNWYQGDYALDINLIGVTDADITIKNSTFAGKSGGNSPIKVTQRGGIDDINTDIPYYVQGHKNTPATIKSLLVENCDFTKVTGNSKGDVIIGSSPNADGTARTSATKYNYKVVAKEGTTTEVYTRSTKEAEDSGSNKSVTVTDEAPLMQLTNYVLNSDEKSIEIKLNEKHQLNYYFGDKGSIIVNEPKITFTSSDEDIATVTEEGIITAKKEGTVKITASYDGGKYEWTVDVVNDVKEEVTNPKTSDSIILVSLTLLVSLSVLTATSYKLIKK